MKVLKLLISIIILSSCSWKPSICNNNSSCIKYRTFIKTHKFEFIQEGNIPSCVLTRAGDSTIGDNGDASDLICKKTDRVIGCQWYDFKDGSAPGYYYIVVPTNFEIRRNEREKRYLKRKYNMEYMSPERFDSLRKDTSIHIVSFG